MLKKEIHSEKGLSECQNVASNQEGKDPITSQHKTKGVLSKDHLMQSPEVKTMLGTSLQLLTRMKKNPLNK